VLCFCLRVDADPDARVLEAVGIRVSGPKGLRRSDRVEVDQPGARQGRMYSVSAVVDLCFLYEGLMSIGGDAWKVLGGHRMCISMVADMFGGAVMRLEGR
jgi:hypothetical protein